MTQYAAYDDHSIYAVADSPEAAIAKARDDAREPESEYSTAPIGDRLAEWIAINGWDGMRRSFELERSGYLVDTTHWPLGPRSNA